MGKNEKKKVQIQKKLPRKAGPELEESPAQSKSASAEAKPKSRMKRKATEKLRDAETMTGLPSASEPDPYSKRTSIRHISRRYSKPIRPSLLYRDEEWSSTSTEEEENDEEKVDKKRKAEVSGKTVKGRTKRKKRVEEKPKKERKVPVKPPERKQSIGADPTMKRLEELTQMAFAMGIDSEAIEAIIPETASKKKLSKKEKARMTAELAEKARLEAEAQAKMLEELMKQKHEQDRLAAIEKDKKEAVEHQLRIEQLQESRKLMDDIVESYLELERLEREEIEWKKYVDCGRLPNPLQCDRMNTYLHLWEQVISDTTVEDASARTADVIQLLEELDEHLDAEEDPSLVKNLKWIRSMFRDRQKESLDVATYKLLRNVEHNLNRINIPTADFNFKDEYVTLCLWLRVMLPIPLPNPRRPPKPRIDVDFTLLEASVLFPSSIDCENAAIRAMYLKYDHLSDTSDTYKIPQLRKRYCWDLLEASKLEWRAKRKYKYDNRDKEVTEVDETQGKADTLTDGDVVTDEIDEFKSDDEIPSVPFKQLDPTASAFAITCEDNLYAEIRTALLLVVPEHVINLRRFVILGGVYHLDYLAQPPQPQDFITMDMTITALSLPKKLETVPFYAAYNPPLPPEDPTVRRLPEEIEEEMRRQEAELDKLIAVNIKWPQHVIFLELPVVCRWDEEARRWSKKEIFDLKHNEDKCVLSFRTGVFGTFGLATYRYANLPFQAYDIKPEADDSVTVQLTAAILMLEFNIKEGLVCITQLQNSPNMALQDIVGTYFKLPRLKRIMKEAGIDIFPSLDAFCYVEGSCEKQWAMERHLYFNMAQLSNCFNFAWSRWNLQAGRRSIVLQMRNYVPSKAKQKTHQMLLITPQRASFVDCTEVSQVFSDNDVEPIKFCADLYHLMKTTSGIFVRNKVLKTSKVNVYALANFLESIRILSFS